MNVALLEVDNQKFPNLALMKLARFHKNQGHNIEWFDPLFSKPDILYASKIFKFTPDYEYFPQCEIIKGGTGYSLAHKLPVEIENLDPDYSIYKYCNFSLQMFSRGCIHNCEWCVVPEKEGFIEPSKTMNLNTKGEWIEILDNNFFANPEWHNAIEFLIKANQPVNFHGIDIRFLSASHMKALRLLKHMKQIRVAWDNPHDNIYPKLVRMIDYIKPYQIMVYVLIGFNSSHEEDLKRVTLIKRLGMDPFVMPFNKSNNYQKRFARWVNHKAIFKTVEWKDYK